MEWVIGLNLSKSNVRLSPKFQRLRWQLLGAFLGVMVAINFLSSFLVYQFFSNILYQQLDQKLKLLADSAAHSLDIIEEDNNLSANHQRYLDDDHDLDLSWKGLKEPNQSIEWFNEHRQFLGSSGKKINLGANNFSIGFTTLKQSPPIRILVIVIYEQKDLQIKKIEGYIRVTESTESITMLLSQLSWGFAIGSFVTLSLTAMGGMWLTQQSLKPLAKSYDQLKQFTGDASHELRSPLTAIKTSAEVLQTHPERIHPQDIEKVNNIVSATNQMGHLIEDLLLLARTDNELDLLPQQTTFIPLEELLEDVVTFLEVKAEQKNIKLQSHYLSNPLVKGNAFQLQRLFTNLVDNAIKYTGGGGDIDVKLDTLGKWAVITIQDTGIGIKKEHIDLIFDRFWRAEKARSPQTPGSGLGLAIVQSIVQHHQGQILVESELNQGSCFTILLPVLPD